MRSPLILLMALLVATPSVLAVQPRTYQYVLGAGLNTAGHDESLFCAGVDNPDGSPATPVVGGVCNVTVTARETVHVAVVDDVLGSGATYQVSFLNTILLGNGNSQTETCAPKVHASGAIEIVIPDGCSRIDVTVDVGGIAGTISIS